MTFEEYILSQTRPFNYNPSAPNTSVGVDTPDNALGSVGTANPAPSGGGEKDGIRSVLMKIANKGKAKPLSGNLLANQPQTEPVEFPSTSRSFLSMLFGGGLY